MIISTDAGKDSDKIQHSFLIVKKGKKERKKKNLLAKRVYKGTYSTY